MAWVSGPSACEPGGCADHHTAWAAPSGRTDSGAGSGRITGRDSRRLSPSGGHGWRSGRPVRSRSPVVRAVTASGLIQKALDMRACWPPSPSNAGRAEACRPARGRRRSSSKVVGRRGEMRFRSFLLAANCTAVLLPSPEWHHGWRAFALGGIDLARHDLEPAFVLRQNNQFRQAAARAAGPNQTDVGWRSSGASRPAP